MMPPSLLLVPGLNGSGPGHWQAAWAATRSRCTMLVQDSWDDPWPARWTARLDQAIAGLPGPVVLVAHSLGCATVAHWAATHDDAGKRVAAALLVAPCDVERPGAPASIARFQPMPRQILPFRSTVVASRNDPYATLGRARGFADSWGSAFVDAGALGHINAAAGLGDWPLGRILLDALLAAAGLRPATV